MTVFKIFIVATALLLCPSLGAGYNCTRRYQRLLKEAAVVKAQCPNAAFHDCCQVGGCLCKEVTLEVPWTLTLFSDHTHTTVYYVKLNVPCEARAELEQD